MISMNAPATRVPIDGRALHRIRVSRGVSLVDLAQLARDEGVRVGCATLDRIEVGLHPRVKERTLDALAAALAVEPAAIRGI